MEGFHQWIRDDPRMAEIRKAASESTSYREAVKAKLDALTAEEVKKLPFEHGAREFQKWWDKIGLMDEEEDTIMVMDGHKIVVPHGAWKKILQLLHVPHMATARTRKAAAKKYFCRAWLMKPKRCVRAASHAGREDHPGQKNPWRCH